MIVFDLDGTLSLTEHRLHHVQKTPKDWDAFFDACIHDPINAPVANVALALFNQGQSIEIWSGRSERVREQTELWLASHRLDFYVQLRMRPDADRREDHVVKREWLHQLPRERWPRAAFEDRSRVVAMWREAGIPCFQVAPGDF